MNRKEKEQNTDVSKQICVHKTQNTLLEFNSFLRMAEPKEFWHLHEDFASDYSRIRAVMVDYSKEDIGTGGPECGPVSEESRTRQHQCLCKSESGNHKIRVFPYME